MKPVGAFEGYSFARGLNDAGQVVGSFAPRGGGSRAFLFDGAGIKDLGTLGGIGSEAYAINNLGQVVGSANTVTGEEHAFRCDRGDITDLGTLGGLNSIARGINDRGAVVGDADTPNARSHAFLWRDANGNGRSDAGEMRDLGTLGGPSSQAWDLNEAGHVVGVADTGRGRRHAFLFNSRRMIDLGALGGPGSGALGINNAGMVVGWVSIKDKLSRAFLCRGGTMEDLNDRLPARCGWVLETAQAINDAGQILGQGRFRGQQRSFLLTLKR